MANNGNEGGKLETRGYRPSPLPPKVVEGGYQPQAVLTGPPTPPKTDTAIVRPESSPGGSSESKKK